MTDLTVRLTKSTDSNDTFDLEYDFCENSFVEKWKELFQFTDRYEISTKDQFYGINNEWTAEKTIEIINKRVDQLNEIVPGLIDRKIQSVSDQDTLNYLHAFFEQYHGKVHHWLKDPWWNDKPKEMQIIWSDLNNYIHRLEGYRTTNEPHPRIKVAWYDMIKIKKFQKEDYKNFETGFRFGYIYSLYSDVGKDFQSLAFDNDNHHYDFVPPTYYSTDFQLRFHNTSQKEIKEIEKHCWSFYDRNENWFKSKGYEKDDPRLVIGSIPIARLNEQQEYWQSDSSLLNHLKDYNRIQSVYLN